MDERALSASRRHAVVTQDDRETDRRRRDQEFSGFYRDSIDQLVTFLLWHGARLVDAVEVAQDAMTAAYAHWDTIYQPRAWVRRVAARAWGRRLASVQEYPVDEVPERTCLLRTSSTIDAITQRHDVLQALNCLPLRQRQVMAWTMDGFTAPEIAEELGITPEAVRSSLLKARRALVARLSREEAAADG